MLVLTVRRPSVPPPIDPHLSVLLGRKLLVQTPETNPSRRLGPLLPSVTHRTVLAVWSEHLLAEHLLTNDTGRTLRPTRFVLISETSAGLARWPNLL